MKADRWLAGAGLLSVLNTANAYRPLVRRGKLGALSFAAGWPTTEAPAVTIGAQALGVAALAGRRGARTPLGQLGVALAAGSWVALAKLAASSAGSGDVLERALEISLGTSYRHELDTARSAEVALTRVQRMLPTLGDRRYRVARHVPYGDGGRFTELDIWRDPDLPVDGRAPVVVYVHGGGWIIGTQEVQGELMLTEMARRGWVGVSITYRLSPKAVWPAHIVDVKRALAWTKANIATHGGDPAFVAIAGSSAGGHLAALAALTANDPAFQPGFEDADTSVQAAVPFYGVYDVADLDGSGRREILDVWERFVIKGKVADNLPLWQAASPVTRAVADAPPMFVLHGTNDTLVPVEQARQFVQRLRQVSTSPVAYAELPGAQHAFEVLRSVRGTNAVRAVARFLDVVHHRWQERQTRDAGR